MAEATIVTHQEAAQARQPGLQEYAGILAFFVLCGWILFRVVTATLPLSHWTLLLAGFAGFVASDFASGFVHWAFDTWGATTTLILGPTFIEPFRIHHRDPKDITRHGFVATNGHNASPRSRCWRCPCSFRRTGSGAP